MLKKFVCINLKNRNGRSFVIAVSHSSFINLRVGKVNERHLGHPFSRIFSPKKNVSKKDEAQLRIISSIFKGRDSVRGSMKKESIKYFKFNPLESLFVPP